MTFFHWTSFIHYFNILDSNRNYLLTPGLWDRPTGGILVSLSPVGDRSVVGEPSHQFCIQKFECHNYFFWLQSKLVCWQLGNTQVPPFYFSPNVIIGSWVVVRKIIGLVQYAKKSNHHFSTIWNVTSSLSAYPFILSCFWLKIV